MTGEGLKPILTMLAGFWPSPAMTPEEVMAWAAELIGHLRITPEEASTVLRQFAEGGTDDSKFRPRAGQIVAWVQALRRKRAGEVSSRALIERRWSGLIPPPLPMVWPHSAVPSKRASRSKSSDGPSAKPRSDHEGSHLRESFSTPRGQPLSG
jgi:hypothetical protein